MTTPDPSDDRSKINIENSEFDAANNNLGTQNFYNKVNINKLTESAAVRACPTPPARPDHFGGRDEQLRELCEGLKCGEMRAITAVHGLGGIGKTTLAREASNVLFEDKTFRAVLWADVTRNPDASRILETWGQIADPKYTLPNAPLNDVARQVKSLLDGVIAELCEHCDGERVLVVLDDIWDDQEGKGKSTVRQLREACPQGSTVLITTRSQNLALDLGAQVRQLDRLDSIAGIDMLRTYLPDADAEALGNLVVALGGHPLALTLAAKRIGKAPNKAKALSTHTADYEAKLPLGVFDGLDLGKDREDNLTLVLSYSYDDLSEADQERFRALGVLSSDVPFDLQMLAVLWNIAIGAVEACCTTLRLLSLLELDTTTGEGWYRQHPLLRAYARALLNKAGEYETIFVRYTTLVNAISEGFYDLQPEDWGVLTPYLPHVHTVGNALVTEVSAITPDRDSEGQENWAAYEPLLHSAQLFAINTGRYLFYRREVRQIDWSEMGLTVSHHLNDQKNEARFLNDLGLVYDDLGEKVQALQFYEQALPMYRTMGDRGGEAAILNNLGNVYNAIGENAKALDFFEQALPLLRAVGRRGGEATTLSNIGAVYSALGEKGKALEYYEQALPLRRTVGDRGGEATTLNNIGMVYSALGEKGKALEYYEQALPMYRTVGDRGGEAGTLNNIGMVYSALGEKGKALEYYEQVLNIIREVGDRRHEATTLSNIGVVYSALGEKGKALEYYEQALQIFRAVGDRFGESLICFNIGMIYWDLDNLDEAIRYLARTVELDEQIHHPDLERDRDTLAQLIRLRDGDKSSNS